MQAKGEIKPLTAHDEQEEEKLAREHSSPRAIIIDEIIREDGEQELTRTVSALTLSGLAAGLSMDFSFLTQALLMNARASAGVTGDWKVPTCLGYSIGFVFTVLGKQQLFTESTLTAVLPLFTRPDLKTLWLTARLWLIVLLVNIAGTWLFAALLVFRPLFSAGVSTDLHTIAGNALYFSFGATFLKAVLAGWLIALMVWILPSTLRALAHHHSHHSMLSH